MPMTIDIPEGYESLGLALGEAVAQAARGKGSERHAEKDEPFSSQLICAIPKRLGPGGECFCLGQAVKKIYESRRLPPERARAELLGAINYLAAAWGLLGGFADAFGTESGAPFEGPHVVPVHLNAEGMPEKPVSAPEDIGTFPHFEKGEILEYRSADGTWKPARFAFMDGGYFVVDAGEERFGVLGFDVRKAEKAG